MNDIAIYVLGHTKLPFLFAENYIPFIRGERREDIRREIIVDTVGDNISSNENMPDINFLYWIWKNTDIPEYIGVCHYRRFFNFSGEELRSDGSNFFKCTRAAYAVDMLKYADVILLPPEPCASGINVAFQYFMGHSSKYMYITYKVICDHYPEYRSSFLEVMDSKVLHARCIFVTKKHIFNKFMEFVTGVLFEVEKIAVEEYPYEKRAERFLAYVYERLMDVFWIHNKLKIKECNLIQLSFDKRE